MLEALGPEERVIFLLADVFAMPFDEIAAIMERSPAACRQVASRARKRVGADRDAWERPAPDAWQVAGQLVTATMAGDMEQVVALLADDAVLLSDGGPSHRAARHPIMGPHRISRLLVNLAARMPADHIEVELATRNGDPGVVVHVRGALFMTLSFTVVDSHIARVHIVRNPDKLAALELGGSVV